MFHEIRNLSLHESACQNKVGIGSKLEDSFRSSFFERIKTGTKYSSDVFVVDCR